MVPPSPKPPSSRPLAITGLSCRFAGSSSTPSKLWTLLSSGTDAWSPIPATRFDGASLYHPEQQRLDRHHVQGGYFLDEDISAFDAPFFGVATEAAEAMDPQLRLSMEGVFEAFEDAGYTLERMAGSNTSVFSGTFGRDYSDRLIKDPETLPASYFTGNGAAMYSNRISHFYDLRGPSVTTDTGCSGGMAALHLAAQSIRSGEAKIAIACVAHLSMNPDLVIALSNLGVLSPQGKCLPWDERANGYGRGEGMAVVILKDLDEALRDGDHVHAVIRESVMNQDGKTGTITSPAMRAQQELIRDCYRRAGLNLADTAYIEAHMTGTPTGDPIEAEALATTFGASRAPGRPVYVGSCKGNLGHTEPVSGLAAIIPPHINYEKTNPAIRLEEWNLKLPLETTPWPAGAPLRASVNNFGYGGTNVHVIMEAAPRTAALWTSSHISNINGQKGTSKSSVSNGITVDMSEDADVSQSYVVILSARHSAGVSEMAKKLSVHLRESLRQDHNLSLADVAYTLSERRSRFQWSTAIQAMSVEQLAEKLEDQQFKSIRAGTPPRIGFVFNGQGGQWPGMGRELLARYPVFSDAMRKCTSILQESHGASWSLYDELCRNAETSRIDDAEISQPANVALQICLVDLLKSWGIVPAAVASHSSGEIAAAYAVGMLTAEEALGVVYHRGSIAARHRDEGGLKGGMMAARLSANEAEEYIKDTSTGKIVVACVNSPASVTLSGDLSALDEVAVRLANDAVSARKLNVPVAYHSHHMQQVAEIYEDRLNSKVGSKSSIPKIPFASPVTGRLLGTGEGLDAKHWVKNLVSPVLFSSALECMVYGSDGQKTPNGASDHTPCVDVLLEIGAHNTLSGAIKETLSQTPIPYTTCLRRNADAVKTMQAAAGDLVTRGCPVDLYVVNHPSGESASFVPNLPTYCWDHRNTYTVEPRTSHQNRYRRYPPHELLGSSAPGTNSLVPTWRNFLRTTDLPWLSDHQLESKTVFPGAGYVCMAIEAVRQLKMSAGAKQDPAAYRLRDVDIQSALVIPPDATGVEVVFTLRDCSDKELDYRGWHEFELFSIGPNDAWSRHCIGFVSTEDILPSKTTFPGSDDAINGVSPHVPENQGEVVDAEVVFDSLRRMGIYHGPTFRHLDASRILGLKSTTTFRLSAEAQNKHNEYVLHPITLDSIFQTCYFSLPREAREGAMMVPRSIGSMTVPRGLLPETGKPLTSTVELQRCRKDAGIFAGTVTMEPKHDQLGLALEISNFRVQRVAADEEPTDNVFRAHSQARWELDVLHRVPQAVKESMQIALSEAELADERSYREAAYYLMVEALTELQSEDSETWQSYHKRYFQWMKAITVAVETGQLENGHGLRASAWTSTSQTHRETLLDAVAKKNAGGRLLVDIGRHLAQIIRGDINALEIMTEGGLLERYYAETPQFNHTYQHLRRTLELYAVKNPGARVLEIGAGTGGATTYALAAFSAKDERRATKTLVGHYDYTDISSDFFAAAKEKFAHCRSKMDFRKLNIEADPIQQGFDAGTYDLVIASQVLHATVSLRNTLTNVRTLLKPGGKLIYLEGTQHSINFELIFGTLPGWWLGEEPYRQMSAIANVPTWNKVLRSSGFTGVDFNIQDCVHTEVQVSSLIMSTAFKMPTFPSRISIVGDRDAPPNWHRELATTLYHKTGTSPHIEFLEDVQPDEKTLYIVTVEMSRCLVSSMDQKTFEKLRHLLVDGMGILWVGRGGFIDAEKPHWGSISGLLRTLRREDTNKRCVHLDFDTNTNPWGLETVQHIMHVFEESLDYSTTDSDMDWEYAVKDSVLHVLRYYPDEAQDVANSGQKSLAEPQPWRVPGRDLQYQLPEGSIDLLDHIAFHEVPDANDDLPYGMIEIDTKAFALNFQDLMLALGFVKEVMTLAHEAAGVVKRLGPGTDRSGLKVGDRVCGAFRGGFASTSRGWWENMIKAPDELSWEEAAAFPIVHLTVNISLVYTARLQKGERILIHSAAGGVGQAAIMWAQSIGAEIFATCGTKEKNLLLQESFGIPADHIFSSRNTSFVTGVMKATDGKGVDVVLNSLGGPLLKATWQCLADFGRFVEIGKIDLHAAKRLDMSPFARNITMSGVDLIAYSELKRMVIADAYKDIMRLYHAGKLRPVVPITTFSVTDMGKAMKFMQGGTHTGKLVIHVEPNSLVSVIPRTPVLELDKMDFSHLVVGGLTGIGNTIVMRLIDKGAKNIVAVSRNAVSHRNAAALREMAQEHGCRLLIQNCDIANDEQLLQLVQDLREKDIPPIGGVVQAAMVLDDTVLERMTYEQWQNGVRPKIAGTWNLHNLLPELNYFIMLSSGTGITGNPSQANYAAGNTFEDMLARHRTQAGHPALSIDLGAVDDVGYVAEQGEDVMKRVGTAVSAISLSVDHVMRLVEGGITNPLRRDQAHSHTITCFPQYAALPDDRGIKGDKRFGTLRLGDDDISPTDIQSPSASRVQTLIREFVNTGPTMAEPEAKQLVRELLSAEIGELFNIDPTDIDPAVPLTHHGVDSLVAVRFRNWISSEVKARVTIFEILQSASLVEFAGLICSRSSVLSRV
ncbi:polyketide synthase-like protein [Pseudovirgaria hyperparasitica]|uniref:Polyketide synthase-like protein n=1 Tax=Pseudovirgaria hyperparasitica TaxID=470096 RepID=A0A6A6W039_9PEZI|nr:polyketide synthase-like protein [Pseudovirgaria hyperparasitica]KAF2754937.1 polyketide synthase-like protein [Pseudovirgaria hyperparasitica]